MRTLALFDFDGTITSKDTFLEFIKFTRGSGAFYRGFLLLAPLMVAMKLGLYPNWKAKERVLIHFFRGTSLEQFNSWGLSFARDIIPQLVRPKALEQIKSHVDNGDEVYVVSASPENWLLEWTNSNNLKLISTKLECLDSTITGKIQGKNCYGPEKVKRIKAQIDLKEFDNIVAYGDSSGDKEMLAMANESHFKPFR